MNKYLTKFRHRADEYIIQTQIINLNLKHYIRLAINNDDISNFYTVSDHLHISNGKIKSYFFKYCDK